jgi:UDP-glucose 6-dehydrogenase
MNLLYDAAQSLDADWGALREILAHDPWIGQKHLDPVNKGGRGAGGNCFVKDFAALAELYVKLLPDDAEGGALFEAIARKNIALLRASGKGMRQIQEVYGGLL